jgi:hypothetical protein
LGQALTTPVDQEQVQFHPSHISTVGKFLPHCAEWSFCLPNFFANEAQFGELAAMWRSLPASSVTVAIANPASAPCTTKAVDSGTFFEEVIVRPAKSPLSMKEDPDTTTVTRPMFDATQLASLEKEASEIDNELSQLLQRQENPKSKL